MEIKKGVYDREEYNFFIVNKKFIIEYGRIVKSRGISIYNVLKMHADRNGYCFPEQKTIAKILGIDRDTVSEGIKSLEKYNIIEVVRTRKSDGSYKNHAYFLNDPSVWKSVDNSVNEKSNHAGNFRMDDKKLISSEDSENDDEKREDPCGKIPPIHAEKFRNNNNHINNNHINKRETPLEELIKPYVGRYAPKMIDKFLLYWTETDKRGKQRWQKQATWEISKRLKRWKMEDDDRDYEKSQRRQLQTVNEQPTEREESSVRIDSGFSGMGQLVRNGFLS